MRPGVERDTDVTLTLEVDGEMFSLRQDESDGNAYTWLSGPNPGYGFGTAQPRICRSTGTGKTFATSWPWSTQPRDTSKTIEPWAV